MRARQCAPPHSLPTLTYPCTRVCKRGIAFGGGVREWQGFGGDSKCWVEGWAVGGGGRGCRRGCAHVGVPLPTLNQRSHTRVHVCESVGLPLGAGSGSGKALVVIPSVGYRGGRWGGREGVPPRVRARQSAPPHSLPTLTYPCTRVCKRGIAFGGGGREWQGFGGDSKCWVEGWAVGWAGGGAAEGARTSVCPSPLFTNAHIPVYTCVKAWDCLWGWGQGVARLWW